MRTLEELVAEVPALGSLSGPHRETIAGCARNAVFEAGDYLMREDDPADTFFVIREGAVALETFVPQRGAITLQTLHDGDLLGWSWLVPPYRTAFDARAVGTAHALAFDGACLRGKCDADPALHMDPQCRGHLHALLANEYFHGVPGHPVIAASWPRP